MTFIPTSDSVTAEVTLQLHIEPTGPDYNLHMRGVVLPVSSGGISLPFSSGGISLPVSSGGMTLPVPEKQNTISWNEKDNKNGHISQWLSGVSRDQSSQISPLSQIPPPSHLHESLIRRSVYIREEEVIFPPTPLNTRSTLKVQVCNRDLPLAMFTVLKPSSPFSVDHRFFKLS